MNKFMTDGNLVYSLIQDGWENGKPKMTNDIYIQVHNKNKNKEKAEELAKLIAIMLNDERIIEMASNNLFTKLEEFKKILKPTYSFNDRECCTNKPLKKKEIRYIRKCPKCGSKINKRETYYGYNDDKNIGCDWYKNIV